MELTANAVRALCKRHNLYTTPSLNDVLYCNFGGFTSVAGLRDYVNVKSIFLEGNALFNLATLPPLQHLKCLYLQNNALTSLEGLDAKAPELHSLNVSSNQLTDLGALAGAANLSTLLCADNRLCSPESIAALASCPELQTVDLQGNELRDFEGVLQVLRSMSLVKCVYLVGNPLVRATPHYRKRMISGLPGLVYLDDRPVFDKEREAAEAWVLGQLGFQCTQTEDSEEPRSVLRPRSGEDSRCTTSETEAAVEQPLNE